MKLLIFIVFGMRTAFCDLSLHVEDSVVGVKGQSLVIPCKYTPADQYSEYEIFWYKGAKLLFFRLNSEDHIMISEFRNRLSVSKSPLGDISMTISQLKTFDKDVYTCTVKLKSLREGNKIVTKEASSSIAVNKAEIRTRTTAKVTNTNAQETKFHTTAETTHTSLDQVSAFTVEISTRSTAKVTKTNAQETKFHTTAEKTHTSHDQVSASTAEISTRSTAKVTNGNAQETKSHTTAETTHTSHNQVSAFTGSGIPFYIVLILGLMCLLSVVTLIIVVLRRNRKNDFDVGILTMNQLAENLAPTTRMSCQPCANQESRAVNDYEPSVDQCEYQSINGVPDNEYEFLLPERENVTEKAVIP